MNRLPGPDKKAGWGARSARLSWGREDRGVFETEIEGDDMDVLLRLKPGSHCREVAQRKSPGIDPAAGRSRKPVSSRTVEAREMVLYLFWIFTLTAPLLALAITTGCTPLRRATFETRFVATGNDERASAVPPGVAGEVRKREPSREIKFGRGGIVWIIERTGPTDEELAGKKGHDDPFAVAGSGASP